MKDISKKDMIGRSIGGIGSIVLAVYLNWLLTPAWTFKSQGFWWYWIIVIAEFTGVQFFVERKAKDFKHKISKIIGKICLIVMAVTLVLMFLSSDLLHAERYSNLIEVEDGDFATDIQQVAENSEMITLDMQTAQQLGSRVIGSLPNISRYSVNEEYNLTKYNGDYYRVTPLEYAGPWKAFTNSSEGLPAYVVVNATQNKADIVNLEKNIKYAPNAFGSYNLKRHLRHEYRTYIFGDFQFEIDDKNNPYYIAPVMEANIGLFGGKTVSSFIIVDAVSGKCKEYLPEELPPWVNHAYSLSNLMELAKYHYGLKEGFWNYVLFENDILKLSYDYKDKEDEEEEKSIDNFDGYSSILINGEVNFLTGLVSTGEDKSMVGFITANPRTGKIKYYDCVGTEEGTAQKSAESLVQNFGYSASYPIVINVEGQETYFMTLKDKTLNNKAFAFVNVKEYDKAVQSENFDEALKLYKQKIGIDTNIQNTSDGKEEFSKEGKIVELYQAIKSGNTNYFFKLEGDEMLYVSSIEINSKQVKMNFGDTVEVTYSSAEEDGVGIVKRITIK